MFSLGKYNQKVGASAWLCICQDEGARKIMESINMIWFIFVLYVVVSATGMVLVKYGGKLSIFRLGGHTLDFQIHPIFLIGLCLYIISFLLWMYILQKFEISFISPVATGIVFIAIAVMSAVVLHEHVTLMRVIGGIIIIGGVFVASIGAK